jgi:hypothetical protein
MLMALHAAKYVQGTEIYFANVMERQVPEVRGLFLGIAKGVDLR